LRIPRKSTILITGGSGLIGSVRTLHANILF
jgi:nucleoside-diphosphate-sugar epimerase